MHIPGSKYIANRVLVMSALTGGRSGISNVPGNTDIRMLLELLTDMGIVARRVSGEAGRYDVWGMNSSRCNLKNSRVVDAGESGTLLRFITGIACLLPGETLITADSRNRQRPILPLLNALRDLGAGITQSPGSDGYPLRVENGLRGGRTVVSGDVSSQFVSSLLIVSPCAMNDVELVVMKPIVSSGYIDVTLREMKRFGVFAERIHGENYDVFRISAGQRYLFAEVDIPGDWSSVNGLIAASVILGRQIKINRMSVDSNPGESKFVSILQRMGCSVNTGNGSVSVVKSGDLRGVEVDMKDSPDSVLTLIAVAVFARGTTVVKNISHLIHKESDRIQKVEAELNKIGAHIETTQDSITVTGMKQLHPAATESHNDHRLAMCLGLIKLRNRGMTIADSGCVRKSFPGFWNVIYEIDSLEEGEKCLEIQ
jgi:3-phosphoshikimate 1-carboxyvinyltransferase